jgi:hypothetical protein
MTPAALVLEMDNNPLIQFLIRANWPWARLHSRKHGEKLGDQASSLEISRESATPWGVVRSFFETYALTVLRRQVVKPCKSHKPIIIPNTILLVAARAVSVSSSTTLGELLLGNGDDVDGDRLELHVLLASCPTHPNGWGAHTPRCLRRSLVSPSTSSWPLSEFWVKSRAETSGTY